MGAETYLFSVAFKTPVPQTEIVDLLVSCGSTFLADKSNTEPLNEFRSYFFEIRSDSGLTEMEVLLVPNIKSAGNFFLRFSILSPSTVIDQSFFFLNKLASKRTISVYDTETGMKSIELDVDKFKSNKEDNLKLEVIVNNEIGLVIESGNVTTDYIYDNNLVEKVWGQKEKDMHNKTLPKGEHKWWQKFFGSK